MCRVRLFSGGSCGEALGAPVEFAEAADEAWCEGVCGREPSAESGACSADQTWLNALGEAAVSRSPQLGHPTLGLDSFVQVGGDNTACRWTPIETDYFDDWYTHTIFTATRQACEEVSAGRAAYHG